MAITPTLEDIAELRKRPEDFREFLRLQFGAPGAPPRPPVPTTPPITVSASSRPGAWPTGTRPPQPSHIGTPEQWAQAVHDYRAWLAAGKPDTPIRCECGCTPGVRKETP
jgi:hypothetical protein